jgi:hypothetical protein
MIYNRRLLGCAHCVFLLRVPGCLSCLDLLSGSLFGKRRFKVCHCDRRGELSVSKFGYVVVWLCVDFLTFNLSHHVGC